MSTTVRAPSEVKVGKTIEIAADWARPSVLPPEPSLSLSLSPSLPPSLSLSPSLSVRDSQATSARCGLGWALGPSLGPAPVWRSSSYDQNPNQTLVKHENCSTPLTFASALGALSSPLKAWRALAGVELSVLRSPALLLPLGRVRKASIIELCDPLRVGRPPTPRHRPQRPSAADRAWSIC